MTYALTLYVTAEQCPKRYLSGEYEDNTGLHLQLSPLVASNRSHHQKITESFLNLRNATSGFKSTRQHYEILRTHSLDAAIEQLKAARARLSSLLLHPPDSTESMQRLLNGLMNEKLLARELCENGVAGFGEHPSLSWRRQASVVWLDGCIDTDSWVIAPEGQTYDQVCRGAGITCVTLSGALFPPCAVCRQPSSAYGVPCSRCAVAFLMGMHERLGKCSPVRLLSDGIARNILRAIYPSNVSMW